MKPIKILSIAIFLLCLNNFTQAQNYSTLAEVLSSGGGESVGSNYSNFGVIGETFVSYSVTGGNYNTSFGFLYASAIIIGINEMIFNNQFIRIFPNPSNDIVYIKTTETGLFIKNIEILNVIGKSVYQRVLDNANDLIKISVTDFQPGFYFIKLHTNKGVVLNKFIINR